MGGKGGKGEKGDTGKGGKSGKGFLGKCWYCDKPGHRANDCWHNPEKGKGKGKGKASKGEHAPAKGGWGQGKGGWGPAQGGKGWLGKGISGVENHPYWDYQYEYVQDLGCIDLKMSNQKAQEEIVPEVPEKEE
eukprot:1273105-Karenia_brevis.AAC.1